MYLRYVLNGVSEIAEVTRMYYQDGEAYFVFVDGKCLCASNIKLAEWNRLVADMFGDGKLSLLSLTSSKLTIR